jgi:hypothetical protein
MHRTSTIAVATTIGSVVTAVAVEPILSLVLASTLLGILAIAAAITLPATWSGKKHRRDAALAVLHLLLSHTPHRNQ